MDPAATVVLGMFGALCGASAVAWTWVLRRFSQNLPLLHVEPRRPVPWGFLDLLILGIVCFGIPPVTVQVVAATYHVTDFTQLEQVPRDALYAMLLASSLSTATASVLAGLAVALRTGATASDFGLTLSHFGRDLRLGLVAFVLLAVPVLGIQFLLTRWFPTTHPLIEIVRQEGGDRFFLLAGLSAVVVAPVVEELQFRAIMQGWFERAAGRPEDPTRLLLGGGVDNIEQEERAGRGEVPIDTNAVTPATCDRPLTSLENHAGLPQVARPRPPRWPMVASAAIFAGLHIGHGPDPVPLFVLALGLGYLYQQTHRLLPCMVVHFLLNSWTMILLFVSLRFGHL